MDCWNAIDRWMATAICKTPLTLLTSKIKVHFTKLALLASQKWWFLWHFCRGKLLLLCLRERGVLIQGSPLKSACFCGTFVCIGKGWVYIEGNFSYFAWQREEYLFLYLLQSRGPISYCLNQTSFYFGLQDGMTLHCNTNLLLRLMITFNTIFQDYSGIFLLFRSWLHVILILTSTQLGGLFSIV